MAFSELSHPWSARGHSNPSEALGGLLLCHGFTGSPQALRPWAQHHADRGWDVELPLLPGHGRTWQEMTRTTWRDWYRQVREAALDLGQEHERIAVGGLSMGGALSLALAADPALEGRIGALVLVNPGITLTPAARLAPLIAPLVPTLPGIGSDIARDGVTEEAYDRMPLKAVGSLRRLFSRVRSQLSAVEVPLLLATSTVDHIVPPTDSDVIAAGVRGRVERLSMTRSHHLAPLDHDAPELFETSARFLGQHLPHPAGRAT